VILWWVDKVYWIVLGLLVGYIWWRLPAHWSLFREWRARKVRTEVDRIQGGFSVNRYIPNRPPDLFIEERIIRFWRQRWDNIRITCSLIIMELKDDR
jgi:hypothetical protein